MRFILVLVMITINFASAQEVRCIDRLLPMPRPSATHQLSSNDWTGNNTTLNSEDARNALRALVFDRYFCNAEEIEIENNINCQQMDLNQNSSMTCYLTTSLGQFVLTKDSVQNVNIIFHRGRRF